MFSQTIHRRCLLHREILKNRLLLAPLTPNSVASIVKNQLGYVAKVSGEVMYIMKCLPIAVEVRRENNCYVELPVTVNNKSYFMSPVTRILQEHAIEIECNSIIPAMYYLDNKWIGFEPRPVQGMTPQVLTVDTEDPFIFQSIKELGSGGLYTYKEIKKAQDAMLFNSERDALSNIIVRKMAGQNVESQGYSSLTLFNKEELEEIANSTIKKLYGYFTILGEWTSGILGIYFIFRAIKYLVEIFLNAVALHKLGGCSFHLLASFWDTLTLFVLHHKQRKEFTTTSSSYMRNSDIPGESLKQIEAPVAPEKSNGPMGGYSNNKQAIFKVETENSSAKLPENPRNWTFKSLRTDLTKVNPVPEQYAKIAWSMYDNEGPKTMK